MAYTYGTTDKLRIYLSVNNRQSIMMMPVTPPEFNVDKPRTNETFDTVRAGEINLIGNEQLKTVSFSSIFPRRKYPFANYYFGISDIDDESRNFSPITEYVDGFSYVEYLDRWYRDKLPMRLVITTTDINMPVTISDFSYKIGTTGDIEYSITLQEVRLFDGY